ncbi:50S ribosomal protein L10 [Candidatus Woesearchaeota archaeon]|nr:50S ribosomal protein L10 [Candidatus Woesearchaeota archaeon]
MKAHVSKKKKDTVKDYEDLIDEYPIVGAVNMAGLPAAQLQNMREQLRDKVVLKVGKRRLIKIALDASKKKEITKLEPYLEGQPALLFTKGNPFELFSILKKNKSSAPAKPGQIAPKNIVIPAGPTPFAPGPVIGELGGIGVKAGIEGGKVAIKQDAVVVKAGEEINAQVAGILSRLNIHPMKVGLDLTAVYEDGEILEKSSLDINVEEYFDNVALAHKWSFNLAFNSGYPTVETINLMVTKAFSDARGLAISTTILADGVVGDVLSKAYFEMMSVASLLSDDAKSDELRNNNVQSPAVVAESASVEAPKEEEGASKKEEESDDDGGDAAEGLGALFG